MKYITPSKRVIGIALFVYIVSGCSKSSSSNNQCNFSTGSGTAATPPGNAAPANTLQAMASIARSSWTDPKTLYALFDKTYPQPADGSR